MIIQYMSDLHFEFGSEQYLLNKIKCESDVLVIAGDLHTSKDIITALKKVHAAVDKHIVFVPGNHEYYYSTKQYVDEQLHQFDDHPYIHILNNSVWEYKNVVFLGSTGWWTMKEAGIAVKNMYDYRAIYDLIAANNGLDWGRASWDFFVDNLKKYDTRISGKPVICVSHNAPSFQSVSAEFQGDSLNPCFVNAWTHLILFYKPAFWIHGHVHNSNEYKFDDTWVLCNPAGYHGHIINEEFLPCKSIKV